MNLSTYVSGKVVDVLEHELMIMEIQLLMYLDIYGNQGEQWKLKL